MFTLYIITVYLFVRVSGSISSCLMFSYKLSATNDAVEDLNCSEAVSELFDIVTVSAYIHSLCMRYT